jgi:hypothetical protein
LSSGISLSLFSLHLFVDSFLLLFVGTVLASAPDAAAASGTGMEVGVVDEIGGVGKYPYGGGGAAG